MDPYKHTHTHIRAHVGVCGCASIHARVHGVTGISFCILNKQICVICEFASAYNESICMYV